VIIYLLRPLIAAAATSFVIATKEAKRPSCCDHLSAHKAHAGPGATAGLCALLIRIDYIMPSGNLQLVVSVITTPPADRLLAYQDFFIGYVLWLMICDNTNYRLQHNNRIALQAHS
jgi:hypothetical protein